MENPGIYTGPEPIEIPTLNLTAELATLDFVGEVRFKEVQKSTNDEKSAIQTGTVDVKALPEH